MTKEIARWGDEAMFEAEPDETASDYGTVRPRVTLVYMTPNPLRVMAAANLMYTGAIRRSPLDVTREEAERAFKIVRNTRTKAPFEFIDLHFFIEGVTRAFTHQLVRQRTAVYVQESLRFAVKSNAEFEVALPPSLAGTHRLGEDHNLALGTEKDNLTWQRNVWDEAVRQLTEAYQHLVNSGMPQEEARGLLPTNITTRVHYKTNLRNLADQAGMRLCSQAQHEWKQVWYEIIRAIHEYPCEYDDIWQNQAITGLFRPVCYETGRCEFRAETDRYCSIRERVEAHYANGELPDTWDDINPLEPLAPDAARRPRR